VLNLLKEFFGKGVETLGNFHFGDGETEFLLGIQEGSRQTESVIVVNAGVSNTDGFVPTALQCFPQFDQCICMSFDQTIAPRPDHVRNHGQNSQLRIEKIAKSAKCCQKILSSPGRHGIRHNRNQHIIAGRQRANAGRGQAWRAIEKYVSILILYRSIVQRLADEKTWIRPSAIEEPFDHQPGLGFLQTVGTVAARSTVAIREQCTIRHFGRQFLQPACQLFGGVSFTCKKMLNRRTGPVKQNSISIGN